MRWSLQTGKFRTWIESLIADGYELKIKGEFTEIPKLEHHLDIAWEAYNYLSTSRRNSEVSIGYIPISEIRAYFSLIGVEKVTKRRLAQIQELDHALVAFYDEQQDKKEKKPQE